MSCRSTPGGRAASACATALTGRSADAASRTIHMLLRELRTDDRFGMEPADPDDVADTLTELAEQVARNAGDISQRRRWRVIDSTLETARRYRDGTVIPWPARSTVEAWRRLPAAMLDTPGIPGQPYHLTFPDFHPAVNDATEALFNSRPSTLNGDMRAAVFTRWVESVSGTYQMTPPRIVWGGYGPGSYVPSVHTMWLNPNRHSIITLLHETRHAFQHSDCAAAPLISPDREVDARAWSLSLFYKTRPALFERLVREGRVHHITPADLKPATSPSKETFSAPRR